jgi:hypothetical protein
MLVKAISDRIGSHILWPNLRSSARQSALPLVQQNVPAFGLPQSGRLLAPPIETKQKAAGFARNPAALNFVAADSAAEYWMQRHVA